MGLLDFLFPKYCVNCRKLGDYLCANCFSFISFADNSVCLVCNRGAIDSLTHPGCKGKYIINGCFSSLNYKGVVKKLIYQFKYKPYLSSLTEVLTELFYEGIIQSEQFQKAYDQKPILAPIPLHPSRFRQRGYNHAELLSLELSKKLNLPTINLLKRTKKTIYQYGLKRDKRKENLKNAFSPSPNILISQYPNIFLVDDILTTGSTLLEASYVLKRNGIKNIWGLTLAKD